MSANKKVPQFLQSALWSYNLDALDLDNPKDRNLIVQSVLNYGTKKQVDWVFENFSKDEIKDILKKPMRGSWWRESLNYWTKIFDVSISKDKYESAIQKIHPQT